MTKEQQMIISDHQIINVYKCFNGKITPDTLVCFAFSLANKFQSHEWCGLTIQDRFLESCLCSQTFPILKMAEFRTSRWAEWTNCRVKGCDRTRPWMYKKFGSSIRLSVRMCACEQCWILNMTGRKQRKRSMSFVNVEDDGQVRLLRNIAKRYSLLSPRWRSSIRSHSPAFAKSVREEVNKEFDCHADTQANELDSWGTWKWDSERKAICRVLNCD
jgi:hypothetical protein